jgi:hypothetical protein
MNNHEPTAAPHQSPPPRAGLALRAAAVVLARGRFVLLVGGLLALIAAWPYLQNQWDKLTRSAPPPGAVASNTEYWCPMCPGVVSDWPSKCPVCNMTLVRRLKDEMTPRPDGAVPRMQLSPYRLQLAGIRTAPVEFIRLEHEIAVAGFLEAASGSLSSTNLILSADVFERDAAILSVGQIGSLTSDSRPDQPFPARIVEIVPAAIPAAGRRVRMIVENKGDELRPGPYALAKFHTPAARLEAHHRAEVGRWRDRSVVASFFAALGRVDAPPSGYWPLYSLFDAGVRQAAARAGFVVCIPESAVIDTGKRQVVYVETMPGQFDAVEVLLGRRCGDHYPVHAGLELGQRVATTGAVLLDAESRLNPNVAATYFGAGARPAPSREAPPSKPGSPASDDKQLIARQKTCPVTGGDLDAMGGPKKVVVDGRVVFICCEHCEGLLRQKPALYLSKLPK